jgi:hypothetical protein
MRTNSRLVSALRGGDKHERIFPNVSVAEPVRRVPTVKFDPARVTDAIKEDIRESVSKIKDFGEPHFDCIYEAALRSVSRGMDAAALFNAIMDLQLPAMTKRRAGEISININRRAKALVDRNEQMAIGIKYATWNYSGAPCHPRQDAAHRAANGKRYAIAKGMPLHGRRTMPGREEGCKCFSRPIIPGVD